MQPRKKIGVLTFHRCINYGSYWQAYYLVDGLRARGHDAVLLEHVSSKVNRAEWKCALQPVLPTAVPRSDYPRYALKMLKFFHSFSKLPCSPAFRLEDPGQMETYDLVVVGSDEVWNLHHPWYGGYPLFFGGGIRATRLAAYAASFGNYRAPDGLAPLWADRLRCFDQISVRDENSRRIVRRAIHVDPVVVLDPCLQFFVPPRAETRTRDRPYIAIYGHNFSTFYSSAVRRWADARGCEVVSIGYRNDWADAQWITAGPHEFVRFIAQAEAVATNFFHGCVFALLNTRPFVCELSDYRSTKVRDLMRMLGGERHLVTECTPQADVDAALDEPLAPVMHARIDELRRSSSAYLEQILK